VAIRSYIISILGIGAPSIEFVDSGVWLLVSILTLAMVVVTKVGD